MNSRQVDTITVVSLWREVRTAELDDPSSENRLEIFVSVERFLGPVPAESP
jgi:hypothetical protein